MYDYTLSSCYQHNTINLLPKQVGDIGEMLSKKHSDQKAANRDMFLRIHQNLKFLSIRQGLALRSTHGEEVHSKFMQLFYLRDEDCPLIESWLSKKTNNQLAILVTLNSE